MVKGERDGSRALDLRRMGLFKKGPESEGPISTKVLFDHATRKQSWNSFRTENFVVGTENFVVGTEG